jgi:hypothetical protein
MSDHIPLSPLAFARADEYVFTKILAPAEPFVRSLGAPVMVTDSSAVRIHTGKFRWMGNIDLLVLHDSPSAVLEMMRGHFSNIIIGSRGGFFRAAFELPIDATNIAAGMCFLIEVHVNAIFHQNQPTSVVAREDFDLVEWKQVPSFCGHFSCRLPVPTLRTILGLKASKDIGNDLLDVFTLVAFAEILPEWLGEDFLGPAVKAIADSLDRICRLYTMHYHEDSALARERFLAVTGQL